MPELIGQRDDVVRTTFGHTLGFKTGKPTFVPDAALDTCLERGHSLAKADEPAPAQAVTPAPVAEVEASPPAEVTVQTPVAPKPKTPKRTRRPRKVVPKADSAE